MNKNEDDIVNLSLLQDHRPLYHSEVACGLPYNIMVQIKSAMKKIYEIFISGTRLFHASNILTYLIVKSHKEVI